MTLHITSARSAAAALLATGMLCACGAAPSPAPVSAAPAAPAAPVFAAPVAATPVAAEPSTPQPAPVTIKIVGFNDYHGNLQSPGSFGENTAVPAAERPPVGGADYLAAAVARLKAQNPRNVVVGAGDFIGASPLISALFHDEPAVETLNRIGVEFNAVGNHEFDQGADELLRLQRGGCKPATKRRTAAVAGAGPAADANSCRGLGSAAPGRFDGATFQWLSANVIDKSTGRPLLPAYGIKRFGEVQVAFIGMTLEGTPHIVSPAGVAGLAFRDEAETVNALVPALRAQGVAAIVVLVHQGGQQAAEGVADINGCDADLRQPDGSPSEIGRIVARLDDAVDLVVSGHTHAAYNCSAGTVDMVRGADGRLQRRPRPTGLPNRAGRLVPVTSASAYGRVLTDIDLTVVPGRLGATRVTATNYLVDRSDPALTAAVAADPSVRRIVDGYAALVAPVAGRVVARLAAPLPNAPNEAGEMLAGDLVADAHLAATQGGANGAEMAFTNPGGVRTPGFVPGPGGYPRDLSYGDVFRVQPFGNSLVTLSLSGAQLKDLLEQQFAGCKGQRADRVLQPSNGVRWTWRASAPPCAKVVDLTLTRTDVRPVPARPVAAPEVIIARGVVQNPARRYRVTVNSFMADGGDALTVLRQATDRLGGPQDVDAVIEYLAGFQAPRAPYRPDDAALGLPRIVRLP